MKKQLLAGAITASTLAIALVPTSAQAFNLANGMYKLSNHPDGSAASPYYGLRLDGLLNRNQNDEFTFDFDHSASNMKMSIQNDEVRIFGTTFGGRDIGSTYDPNESGKWDIDFTYKNVIGLNNDDDLIVKAFDSNSKLGFSRGTITQQYGANNSFDLADYAGKHNYTFRLGDGLNNNGHRGYDGISGWGWLNHAPENDLNNYLNTHLYASDWLFTATPVPTPALLPGLIGMGIASIRKKKKQIGENA